MCHIQSPGCTSYTSCPAGACSASGSPAGVPWWPVATAASSGSRTMICPSPWPPVSRRWGLSWSISGQRRGSPSSCSASSHRVAAEPAGSSCRLPDASTTRVPGAAGKVGGSSHRNTRRPGACGSAGSIRGPCVSGTTDRPCASASAATAAAAGRAVSRPAAAVLVARLPVTAAVSSSVATSRAGLRPVGRPRRGAGPCRATATISSASDHRNPSQLTHATRARVLMTSRSVGGEVTTTVTSSQPGSRDGSGHPIRTVSRYGTPATSVSRVSPAASRTSRRPITGGSLARRREWSRRGGPARWRWRTR